MYTGRKNSCFHKNSCNKSFVMFQECNQAQTAIGREHFYYFLDSKIFFVFMFCLKQLS